MLSESLRSVGGIIPSVSRWATEGRKRDCRVCFMEQGPGGEVTVWNDGW